MELLNNVLPLTLFSVPTAHCSCYKIIRTKTATELTLSKHVHGCNSFRVMQWWHKWFLFTRILLAVYTSICCHLKQQEVLTAELRQVRRPFCVALCYRCSELPCCKVMPWITQHITHGVLKVNGQQVTWIHSKNNMHYYTNTNVHHVPKRLYLFLFFFFLGAQCVESGVSCTDCY